MLPRISSVTPRVGSTSGGAELTIYGTGFGSTRDLLRVTAAGARCDVTELDPEFLKCRVQPLATVPAAGYYPSERGVLWSWQVRGLTIRAMAARDACNGCNGCNGCN